MFLLWSSLFAPVLYAGIWPEALPWSRPLPLAGSTASLPDSLIGLKPGKFFAISVNAFFASMVNILTSTVDAYDFHDSFSAIVTMSVGLVLPALMIDLAETINLLTASKSSGV